MAQRRAALLRLLAGPLALSTAGSRAEDDRSAITLLIGFGGSMDFVARLIADQLREALGRPALVLAKPGAGQRLALAEVRRAAPDGRSLLFCTSGPLTIYPNIYTRLDYDPVADFTPICGISSFDVAIATGPHTGATTLAQLIAWSRSRGSGELVYGSVPGNGSLSHFVGIAMSLAANLPMTHVPYKDSGVATIDLAAGRVPMMITGLNAFVEMHRAGKLRLLAVSGEQRSPQVPEVPTLKEAGINVSGSTTTGVYGPPRMAPDLVRRLQDAIMPMLANAAVRERIAGQSMTLWPATGQQLALSLADERKKFEKLVKASGYVPESV